MPALAPGDKPQDDCDVLVKLEEGFEVEFEKLPEVGVATFQPLNWMALIMVEESMASVVLNTPDVEEATYVMV